MPALRHFAIFCDSPSTLEQFYHDVFDMNVVLRLGPSVFMSDGVINMALLQARPGGPPKGIHHYGFQVEDFEEIARRLELAEVDPPREKPSDGRFAEWDARDPEGNRFDIGVIGWGTERTDPDVSIEEYDRRRKALGIDR